MPLSLIEIYQRNNSVGIFPKGLFLAVNSLVFNFFLPIKLATMFQVVHVGRIINLLHSVNESVDALGPKARSVHMNIGYTIGSAYMD